MLIKKMLADFRTSLSIKIAVGGTSGSIQNNLDDDGVVLPTGSYCFTLDSDNAQKEHIIATLTGKILTDIESVSRQGVITSGVVREHRIGASLSITDFLHIFTHNKLLNGDSAFENKLKYSTDLTFTDNKELVSKKYVDDVAIAGGADASSIVKGISKLSSDPSNPVNPIALNSEEVSATAGANKVVRSNASGKIDKGFVDLQTSNPGLAFTGNLLDTKIKANGGIVKDANGLSVLPIGANPVTSGHVFGTTYQNTSTVAKFVTIGILVKTTADVDCSTNVVMDANATPTTVIFSSGVADLFNLNYSYSITFIVPAGQYYKVNSVGANGLASWFECDLI